MRDDVESEGNRDALSTWREAFQVRTKGLGRPGSAFPHSHRPCLQDREKLGCRAGQMATAGPSALAFLGRGGGLQASSVPC